MKEQMIVTINKANGLIFESKGDVKEGLQAVPNGCMRLSGTFGVTGVMNNNQRYYTNDNYKQMVERLQERIANEAVFGELEHPNTMNVDLSNVTHKIESITIDESTGIVSGTILLLNNEKGREIQTLVENGLKLKISSRGRGTVSESGEVKLSVLETYDLVYKPGFSQAQLSMLTESVSEDGSIILETLVSDLDGKGNVVEKQTEPSIDIKAIKESLKAEIMAEIKADSPIVESKPQTVNVDAIGTYMTEVVEKQVAESEAKLQNLIHESMIKFGRATQNWAFESFAPDIVKYLNEKQSVITKSDLDNMARGIQEWAVTDFAQGIQSWSINEFSEDMEAYFKTKGISEMKDEDEKDEEKDEEEENDTNENVNESGDKDSKDSEKDADKDADKEDEKEDDKDEDEDIKENVEDAPKSLLERIDEELLSIGVIESKEQAILESENAEKQKQIDEAVKAENFLMDNMPENVRHLWESTTEEFKTQVKKQATAREFTNESQVVRFWLNRFTKDVTESLGLKSDKKVGVMNESQSNSLLSFAKMIAS